jgi:hypothetical protein
MTNVFSRTYWPVRSSSTIVFDRTMRPITCLQTTLIPWSRMIRSFQYLRLNSRRFRLRLKNWMHSSPCHPRVLMAPIPFDGGLVAHLSFHVFLKWLEIYSQFLVCLLLLIITIASNVNHQVLLCLSSGFSAAGGIQSRFVVLASNQIQFGLS